jgi:hypothetical protein
LDLEEALSGTPAGGDGEGKFELEGEMGSGAVTKESQESPLRRAQKALQQWARDVRRLFRRDSARPKGMPRPRLPLRKRLANWGKALRRLPAYITQSLLDRQRAALLRLLREFREGDPDKALRRALPAADAKTQSVQLATNALLPFHNLFYSLWNLFGSRIVAGAMRESLNSGT